MQILEGCGWRLQIDPARQPFSALIGGEDWAVELCHPELEALRLGVETLLGQWRALRPTLMAEEQLELEIDRPLDPDAVDGLQGCLHLALSADGDSWSLRFILTPAPGRRAVEGAWSRAASPALAAALENLPPSL